MLQLQLKISISIKRLSILFFRYSGIRADDFCFLSTTTLGKACGATACDSNHVVSNTTPCISYEGGAAAPEAWALKGDIVLCGQFQNVPNIKFCSRRLAQIFIKGTDFLGEGGPINQNIVLKKIKEVQDEYKKEGILWDLVFWCKFSGTGKSFFSNKKKYYEKCTSNIYEYD